MKPDHKSHSQTRPAVDFPLVSVVTPSYNQGKFIEQTICSVLNQDYPNVEYIMVDGGSTDNSLEVIRKYADRFSSWVSEPDKGQADAIRKGFEKSSGQILAWLNSDDVYFPDTISTIVEAFKRHPKADLIYGDVIIVDENGDRIGERRLTKLDRRDFLGQGNCLAQPASFWRREIYDKVGGINPEFYYQMDLDLYIRIASAGSIKHIRSLLAEIRMQPEGKMSTAEAVRITDLAHIQDKYLDAKGIGRFLYTKQFLLPRLFLRHALQGDLAYVGKKTWRRIIDRQLFRDSRS